MATKIFKILAASIALGAVIFLGTELAMAQRGSGGGMVAVAGMLAAVAAISAVAGMLAAVAAISAAEGRVSAAARRISAAVGRVSAAARRISAAVGCVSAVRMFAASAALTSVARKFAALTSVVRRFAALISVARRFAALALVVRRFAALTSVARRFAALASVALARWAVGPLGTSGVIIKITGGPVGTAGGADGAERPTGPTSTATFSRSRSGLMTITTRSGLMEMYSSGMPCSGPVPITPMAQGILMYMETMRMAALHERAPLEPAMSTAKSQAPQPTATI